MNLGDDANRLAAEARARVLIDRQLTDAGWSVQDSRSLNLFAAPGIARREATMATGHGRADYLLYVDQRVVGVIEAKPEGTPLSGVEWQSAMYAEGLPADVRLAAQTKDGRLPFVFEASGTETHFTNGFDPEPAGPPNLQLPQAGHPRQDPAQQGRGAPHLAGQGHRDATAGHHSPTASADRGDQRRRAEPARAAL